MIVPLVWYLNGLRTLRWTMKFGRRATGGTFVKVTLLLRVHYILHIPVLTMIVPPVWYRNGLRTLRWTMKFGRRATGGTSVIVATLKLHCLRKKKFALIDGLDLYMSYTTLIQSS